jgi:hypothetical protein
VGWLRDGDHLVVVAVDRLGRSVREVVTALHELTARYPRSVAAGRVDTSTRRGGLSPASWPRSRGWSWNSARRIVLDLEWRNFTSFKTYWLKNDANGSWQA